jgi:hypothetical protein
MVNKTLWKYGFTVLPRWPCPTCSTGHLVLIRNTLQRKETGPSIRSHNNESFGPWDVEERFSALLECNNLNCKQVAAICGSVGFDQAYLSGPDGEPNIDWVPFYVPKYMEPAPPVFRIPAKCPNTIRLELEKSFALIWSDKDSCATRMRGAVEVLLNERGIPKTTISNGRRVPLSLHARIGRYKSIDSQTADKLLAIKWIGNVGSHSAPLPQSLDDLMDGFALFANVIDTLYVRADAELFQVARRINKRRGRRSLTRKR